MYLQAEMQSQTLGLHKRPSPDNPVSRKRRHVAQRIENLARQTGEPKEIISLEMVKQNIGALKRYVAMKGEQPSDDPISLSIQAAVMRQKDVDKVAENLGFDNETANYWLDENEARNSGDNFIGGIIEAIGNVAKKGVEKAKQKRLEKGKGVGLLNTIGEVLGGSAVSWAADRNLMQGGGYYPGNQSGVGIFAGDVVNEIRSFETKKQIQKLLPFIIGAVLLIIVITLATSKK